MPEYLRPGVYVEEIDRGPKPIEGVGTAMPVFIGFTEKAGKDNAYFNKPESVTSWNQYVEKFGGFVAGVYNPLSVYGYFLNGGTRCYVLSVKTIPRAEARLKTKDNKEGLIVRTRVAGFESELLRVKVLPSESTPAPSSATPETPSSSSTSGETTPPTTPETGAPTQPTSLPLATKPIGKSASTNGNSAANGKFDVLVYRVADNASDAEIKPLEAVRDISLSVDPESKSRFTVVYKNNVRPRLIELIVPDETKSIESVAPRTGQEQPLIINKALLTPPTYSDYVGDVDKRTGIEALQAKEDITMVVVADLMKPMPDQSHEEHLATIKSVQEAVIAHCTLMRDRVAILDTPPGKNPGECLTVTEIRAWRSRMSDSSYAALYYPWIKVTDPAQDKEIVMPPSGYVAGVWARTDINRGVHKAPANETINGITGLTIQLTNGEQQQLNPENINCIVAFPGRGIRIWGARTISSDPAWRYLNVRRLFNFIEKSIERGTQWVVFEPNEPRLWGRVRRDVGSFLTTVWRDGMLFGLTPDQAFYVKCDADLNTKDTINQGKLIVEIGISPVKPAEFVIFRITQWQPGSEE